MGVKARQEMRALGVQQLPRWPMEDALPPPRDCPPPPRAGAGACGVDGRSPTQPIVQFKDRGHQYSNWEVRSAARPAPDLTSVEFELAHAVGNAPGERLKRKRAEPNRNNFASFETPAKQAFGTWHVVSRPAPDLPPGKAHSHLPKVRHGPCLT